MVRPEEDSGYESGAKIFSKEEMSYVEAVDYGNREGAEGDTAKGRGL